MPSCTPVPVPKDIARHPLTTVNTAIMPLTKFVGNFFLCHKSGSLELSDTHPVNSPSIASQRRASSTIRTQAQSRFSAEEKKPSKGPRAVGGRSAPSLTGSGLPQASSAGDSSANSQAIAGHVAQDIFFWLMPTGQESYYGSVESRRNCRGVSH